MVIFIPRHIWEKQLINLAGRNFGCQKTHRFKPKVVLQVVINASFRLYGEM